MARRGLQARKWSLSSSQPAQCLFTEAGALDTHLEGSFMGLGWFYRTENIIRKGRP